MRTTDLDEVGNDLGELGVATAGIVPDVKLTTILMGALPFMLCMVLAIVILCLFPGIATWLPEVLMGPG